MSESIKASMADRYGKGGLLKPEAVDFAGDAGKQARYVELFNLVEAGDPEASKPRTLEELLRPVRPFDLAVLEAWSIVESTF